MKRIRSLLFLLFFLMVTNGSEIAYRLKMTCEVDRNDITTKAIEKEQTLLMDILNMGSNKLKDIEGTIGIIGGSNEFAGATYFTAMTILKLGIRDVKIFCDQETARVLKRLSPDLNVHATLGMNVNYLEIVDMVILGPGLGHITANSRTLIFDVVEYCRSHKKPLVINLDTYFLSTQFVNRMVKFPESGVIFIANQDEFVRIYQGLKKPGNVNVTKVELDENRIGSNVYILRQGCVNRGISTNVEASWISLEDQTLKKSYANEHMLSGAVAAYYFWAQNLIDLETKGPMFQAGVATFAASKLIRKCNKKAFENFNRGMMSSDMMDALSETL